jgi:predicted enzyme related to lactoylglutathione lyase
MLHRCGPGGIYVPPMSFAGEPDIIVLADTEGNRFCIVDPGHEHT